MKKQKDLNYYLNLHWTYRFEWDSRDNIYVAKIAELPDCLSHGNEIEEAAKNIKEALKCHLPVMLEEGDEIPEPPKPKDYKGNIAYRTTPQRHYKIAVGAKASGKSINKYLDELIDKTLANTNY